YRLPTGAEDSSLTVILAKPATGSMTMTWTGNIPLMMITLHTSAASFAGVDVPDAVLSGTTAEDMRWFNLQGMEIRQPDRPGLYIRNGHKILMK
ncbi:MAG: hypothetical protein K2K22_08840, partial [Muribaculaceae bacterium]|nr:hypothetical protein [Muribaculaceae bacterium]